jgi:hypothetical protein
VALKSAGLVWFKLFVWIACLDLVREPLHEASQRIGSD